MENVHTLVVGEVLWDVFPDATRLGGAPLNFAVHLKRQGHTPRIVSPVGQDTLGESATREDVLRQLLEALPHARRFYDVNLRPGFESRELVCDLLHVARDGETERTRTDNRV